LSPLIGRSGVGVGLGLGLGLGVADPLPMRTFSLTQGRGETCGTYSRYPKQLPTCTDTLQVCHGPLPWVS
jgi:hypothetical protein